MGLISRVSSRTYSSFKPETTELFKWWNESGSQATFENVGGGGAGAGAGMGGPVNLKTLEFCNTLGTGEKADYVDVRIWTSFFNKRGNCFYNSDPETRKKVTENDGMWTTNDGKAVEKPEPRLLLHSIKIADNTDEVWANAFHDEGEILLGTTAEEVVSAIERNDVDPIFTKATFREWLV